MALSELVSDLSLDEKPMSFDSVKIETESAHGRPIVDGLGQPQLKIP